MNVLFITSSYNDYLGDSLLHGLRSLLGNSVVDYPKCEPLYKDFSSKNASLKDENNLYGLGFTLYELLDDIPIDRFNICGKLAKKYFDLIIFSNIFCHFGLFIEFLPYLTSSNTIVLDGEDTPQPYPYAGKWWRYPRWFFLPKLIPAFYTSSENGLQKQYAIFGFNFHQKNWHHIFPFPKT